MPNVRPQLHAAWLPDRHFAVFVDMGENQPAADTSLVPAFPSAAHPRQLAALLNADGHTQVDDVHLWLPERLQGAGQPAGALGLWSVPAQLMSFDEMAVLLTKVGLIGRVPRRCQVDPGPALHWLANVEAVARAAALAGHVLPAAGQRPGARDVDMFMALWHTAELDAAMGELAAAAPATLLAAGNVEPGQLTQSVAEGFALSVVRRQARREKIDVVTSAVPTSSRDLLLTLASHRGPSRQLTSQTFRGKPSTPAWLEALNGWARQPQAGERISLVVTVDVVDDEDGEPALSLEFTARDAASPGEVRWLNELQPEVRDDLIATASSIWPPAKAVTEGQTINVDVADLLDFLTETAPALTGAGVEVVIPEWLRVPKKPRGKVSVSSAPSSGLFGMDTVLQASLDVTVDGQQIEAATLTGRSPLVRVDGRWVLLDAKATKRLRALRKRVDAGLALRDVLKLAATADVRAGDPDDDTDEVSVLTGTTNSVWLHRLMSGTTPTDVVPLTTPESFTGTLFPHQEEGLSWLAWLAQCGFGGVLADDMGLGKTAQLIALMLAENDGQTPYAPPAPRLPQLVVATKSGMKAWIDDVPKFAPELSVYRHYGPGRAATVEQFDAELDADIMLTTYTTLVRDAALFLPTRWRRVILDEATAVKNPGTDAAKVASQLQADQRIAVSGTPIENRLADLHTLMSFANPGLLGTRAEFVRRYEAATRAGEDDYVDADRVLSSLRRTLAPFMLQRTKAEVDLGLPDKTHLIVPVGFTAEQATLYLSVRDKWAAVAEEEGRAGFAAIALVRQLLEVANHPGLLVPSSVRTAADIAHRSAKLDALDDLVTKHTGAGEKMLVFTESAVMARMLVTHLEATTGLPVFHMAGDVAAGARNRSVDEFTATDGPAVFVLTVRTGGQALTLTAANVVVHYDRWWNPAIEDQASDRVYRPGQDRPVTVYTLIAKGTIEDHVDQLLAGKRQVAAAVRGSVDAILTGMTRRQLWELTALRATITDQPEAA